VGPGQRPSPPPPNTKNQTTPGGPGPPPPPSPAVRGEGNVSSRGTQKSAKGFFKKGKLRKRAQRRAEYGEIRITKKTKYRRIRNT